jgi:hypothetical protein
LPDVSRPTVNCPDMSLFTDWNSLLLSEYFSPAPANEDVWIQTSRHELDSFGLHLGGAAGLIEAVKLGPDWIESTIGNCAEAARRLASQRRAKIRAANYEDPGTRATVYRGLNAPTYLPYLALWVLASSEAEEGFYAKVGALLDRPFINTPALTVAMEAVWEDLENWTTKETAGRFGIFKVQVLGEHRFVGIPKSQCMVSRKDANGVRQLFAACALRPRQEISLPLFRRIVDHGRDAHYLSNSLRYAMQRSEYHEPLSRLLGEMLNSWDGRPPKTHGVRAGQRQGIHPVDEQLDEITLKLAPSEDEHDAWEIRWRFPASGQANSCTLVIDNSRIPSYLEPSGDCFSTVGRGYQEVCKASLLSSANERVLIRAEYDDEDAYEVGGGIRTSHIGKHDLRILVWDSLDPRLGEELVERDLPIFGPLYLLSSSNFRGKLERYLKNEGIAHEPLPTRSLPTGWVLTCIPDATRLSLDQRVWLTDGNALPDSQARIRFVGGRTIIRAGVRLFAFYDLPMLELEAPDQATPIADGLKFEAVNTGPAVRPRSPIRRFRIQVQDQGRVAFDIKVMYDTTQLAFARLRVSVAEGIGVAFTRSFGLDSFGRPVADGVRLCGANVTGEGLSSESQPKDLPIDLSQVDLQPTVGGIPQETIAAKFLDSLAQLGSISYGAARDQISRLAEADGMVVQPALLILELRSRGHLEIQTDDKGHLVRIHAVPPTIYSVPAQHDGLELFGVCGSLRLQQWTDLTHQADCLVFTEGQPAGRLPVVRMAAVDQKSMEEVAQSSGFLTTCCPGGSIANWAGSLAQATSELSSWGWGSFAADLGQLQRLHPESAQFVGVTTGTMLVDPKAGRQLFRLDDPSVPGLQVYVLGSYQPSGSISYSFVHDSRWGIWISVSAFAAMLKEHYSNDNASPWPIHYDEQNRSFWLPARLRPPSVIERALVFCSGSGPLEVRTSSKPKQGQIELIDIHTSSSIGMASLVYAKFGSGIWLCYRWVPQQIAERISKLLGGELAQFRRQVGH